LKVVSAHHHDDRIRMIGCYLLARDDGPIDKIRTSETRAVVCVLKAENRSGG
jgi:hypothetical protein